MSSYSGPEDYQEGELARLILIVVTPDPRTGASSTSTGSTRHEIYGTIAKDALLLVLEGIMQSSDAFPPLKSVASGLLFFATSADVSRRNIYDSEPYPDLITRWHRATKNAYATLTSASTV